MRDPQSMSDGERGERIRELKKLLECNDSLIRHARNTINNEPYYERTKKYLEETIAARQRELEELIDLHEHAHERIVAFKIRRNQIKNELVHLEKAEQIAAYRKLVQELNVMRETVKLPDSQ